MADFEDLIKQKKYNELIELTTEDINNNPQNEYAYYYRGKAFYYLNELDKAKQDFDNCLQINNKFALAYTSRTLVRMLQFPHTGTDEEEMFNDSIRATEIEPNNPVVHFELGLFLSFVCDTSAIDSYTKAIELNPNYVDAYYNRGLVKSEISQTDEAIKDYTKAIEIDKTYVNAYYNRALDRKKLNDHKGAIEDYTTCIELEGCACNEYFDRAKEYAKIHEFENAITDLEHFTKRRPSQNLLKEAKRLIVLYKLIKNTKNKLLVSILMKFV